MLSWDVGVLFIKIVSKRGYVFFYILGSSFWLWYGEWVEAGRRGGRDIDVIIKKISVKG